MTYDWRGGDASAHWQLWQGLLILMLFGAAGCARSASSHAGAAMETICSMPACEPEAIYLTALDSLRRQRSQVMSGNDSGAPVRVLATVHWWPMTTMEGGLPISMGPLPFSLSEMSKRLGQPVDVVRWDQAVASDGSRIGGKPLIVFGPIDYLNHNAVVLRVNLYLGTNGQELYRVWCVRGSDGWRVEALVPELQS